MPSPIPLPPIQPIGVGTATPHPSQAWNATLVNRLVAPGSTNPPVVFEPPPGLTYGVNEIWGVASGGADWGGCQVWVSTDGATYGLVGTIYAGAVTGVLTATLPAAADPDTADTIAVDLSQSRGQVLSGTRADADNFVTLCYVDGELIAYQTATLTGPSQYGLGTYLRRGCYGTAIGQHGSGAQFARLNAAVFRYPYPASFAGQPVYLKLPAFNIYGQALQELSAVGDTYYPTTGAGASPLDNPLLAALAAGTTADWGVPGTSLIAAADLAPIDIATGLAINLGTLS
jgi:hypothetical protein